MTKIEATAIFLIVLFSLSLGWAWGSIMTENEAIERGFGRMVVKGRRAVFEWYNNPLKSKTVKVTNTTGKPINFSGFETMDGTEIQINEAEVEGAE